MPVQYEVKWPDGEKVSRALLAYAMLDMVQVVYEEAEERVPKGRGRGSSKSLLSKLGTRLEQRGERGIIWDKARHAVIVHEGTKAHPIPKAGRTRRSKHLAIPTAGGVIFRQSAMHPGTKGRPFLTDALRESRTELSRILSQKGEEYLERSLE